MNPLSGSGLTGCRAKVWLDRQAHLVRWRQSCMRAWAYPQIMQRAVGRASRPGAIHGTGFPACAADAKDFSEQNAYTPLSSKPKLFRQRGSS